MAVQICAYPMLAFYRPLLPKHRVLNKGILSELIQPENRKKVSTYTLYETFAQRLVCILFVNSLYNRKLFRIFEH